MFSGIRQKARVKIEGYYDNSLFGRICVISLALISQVVGLLIAGFIGILCGAFLRSLLVF